MRIPFFLQGALFAPVLVGVLFILKMTCPAGMAQGCFADPFLTPMFMPLGLIYKVFGPNPYIISHEPYFIFGYWILVGTLAGLIFDLYKKPKLS